MKVIVSDSLANESKADDNINADTRNCQAENDEQGFWKVVESSRLSSKQAH